jgi:PAS domain S-box-containing protein
MDTLLMPAVDRTPAFQHDLVRALLEAHDSMVFSVDSDYRYTSFNTRHAEVMAALYGVRIELGQSLLDYQQARGDAAPAKENLDRALRGETFSAAAWSGEGQHQRYFEVLHRPIFASTGQISGVLVLAQDMTERERAKTAREQSERMLRQIIDMTPHCIYAKDAEGRLIFANQYFAEMVGAASPEELIGRHQHEWMPLKEQRNSYLKDDQAVIESGQPRVIAAETYTDRQGQVHTLQTIKLPFTPANSTRPAVLAVSIDITARKRAEQALHESEHSLRSFFELPLIGMAVISTDKTWLMVNDELCRLLGYTRDELTQMTWAELTHPDDLAANVALFNRVLAGQIEHCSMDKRFIRRDGQVIDAAITMRCLRNPDGSVDRFVALVQDITERKRAEKALRRNYQRERELSELKSRFVSMVSHEFRNPLATIQITLEMLHHHRQQLAPQELDERFAKIAAQVNRMTTLLDEVLTIGRIQSGKLEFKPVKVNLARFCHEIASDLAATYQADGRIHFTGADDLPVLLDRTLMHLVITNLLTNALKYSPPATPIRLAVEVDGKTATVRVSDQGIGIAPHDLEHLFEPFHRGVNVGEIAGTGLGLAIVKQAVELHGGTVSCTSAEGAGTTFTVTFPTLL